MRDKIIIFIRKAERWFLGIFVAIGRFFASLYRKISFFVYPRRRAITRTSLISIAVLYVIGAIVFGVRLYKQKRYESIDLAASYIYPFPVGHAGRSIIFAKGLTEKILWTKTFAQKMQVAVPDGMDKTILGDMQQDALVMQEAGRLGIKISRQDLDDAFEQATSGVGGEEDAISFIESSYGMNLNQFKQLLLPKLAFETIRNDEFVRVKARAILMSDESKLKDVEKKIQEGTSFEDAAKENSEDQDTKDNGGLVADGDLIFKEISGLPTEIEDALFKLKAGEVSSIVKSDTGYYLLKVDERLGTVEESPTDWYKSMEQKYPTGTWI